MKAQPPSLWQSLRARVRRAQLIIGLGMLACVGGSLVAAPLRFRLSGLGEGPWLWAGGWALEHLWIFAALPGLCYAAARVLELKPWSTALGAAATGKLWVAAIKVASQGVESLYRGLVASLIELLLLGAGVGLAAWAIVRARRAALATELRARLAAEAQAPEYAALVEKAKAGRPAERADGSAPRREP